MPSQLSWGAHIWDLLYNFNQSLEPYVANFQTVKWGSHIWDLIAAIESNIGNFSGGGSGTSAQVVTAPANTTDFSMLPGGVAPTSGVYWAPRDNSTLWTISGGNNQWRVVDQNNP